GGQFSQTVGAKKIVRLARCLEQLERAPLIEDRLVVMALLSLANAVEDGEERFEPWVAADPQEEGAGILGPSLSFLTTQRHEPDRRARRELVAVRGPRAPIGRGEALFGAGQVAGLLFDETQAIERLGDNGCEPRTLRER